MSAPKIIFSLNDKDIIIQCSYEDKMGDICQQYAEKLDTNIDSLLFLYKENKINFELSYKDYANSLDKSKNEMRIMIYKNENRINNNKNILENIKSKYIIQIIFSHMCERIKFKAIRYNKKLQEINNIRLINYKFFSGRYLTFITKEKVNEYSGYSDNL